MQCRMIKMRLQGVDLPKWKLRELASKPGALAVLDVRDDGVGRSIKVARHTSGEGQLQLQDVLYEPHLIWMSDGRFTIAGFERVQVDGQVVNYAQSWLCAVEPDAR
jgi:hypothetical protein